MSTSAKTGGILIILILFSVSQSNFSQKKKIKVGLQSIGYFNPRLIDIVSASIEQIYGVEIIILEKIAIPNDAFFHVKLPRYRADKLIDHLKRRKPDSIDYVLGFISQDISFTKKDRFGEIKQPVWKYSDWGIMGLATLPGKSSILSTYRIKTNNERLFIERVKKLSIHELGHNFGLAHCEQNQCVMQDAIESIKTIDNAKTGLCEQCISQIYF